jgi:hypothetical protein
VTRIGFTQAESERRVVMRRRYDANCPASVKLGDGVQKGIPTLGNAGKLMPAGTFFELDELSLAKGFKVRAVQFGVFRSVFD